MPNIKDYLQAKFARIFAEYRLQRASVRHSSIREIRDSIAQEAEDFLSVLEECHIHADICDSHDYGSTLGWETATEKLKFFIALSRLRSLSSDPKLAESIQSEANTYLSAFADYLDGLKDNEEDSEREVVIKSPEEKEDAPTIE